MLGTPDTRIAGGVSVAVVVIVVVPVVVVEVLAVVGVAGGAVGVTGVDGGESRLVPLALVAVTVNITGVPLVRPATVGKVRVSGVVAVWPVEGMTV